MNAEQVCRVFDESFLAEFNTRLCGGAAEPLYAPMQEDCPAVIWFREDFVASALHEVAHWCIAGAERRRQTDYGYWYRAQRSPADQRRFETVEARPQALEWIFCQAAGVSYRVSSDNFDPAALQLDQFRTMVRQEVQTWLREGLPRRAGRFVSRLSGHSGSDDPLRCHHYQELPR